MSTAAVLREARDHAAWEALARVEDPEIPALTLVDLGIVRFARVDEAGVLRIGLSPTYGGCSATEYIETLVREALERAALEPFSITRVLSPAWSSDWISEEGRRKLAEYGIVPPPPAALGAPFAPFAAHRAPKLPVACPRCGSMHTESLSAFGSTPCKALHRCLNCLEPFECFKCL